MGGILPICPYFSLMHRRSANLFFFVIGGGELGFELRAWHLQSRCSTT
jgi:hypothetical protein